MKIIRDVRVAEKIGYKSRVTVWRKAKTDSDFPQPVRISAGLTGWIESEVDAYLASKIADSRAVKEPGGTRESRGAKAARKRAEHEVRS